MKKKPPVASPNLLVTVSIKTVHLYFSLDERVVKTASLAGLFKPYSKGLIVPWRTKNNIKPIESLNKKLDPNFHQAMIEIEDDEKEPGTIIQEIQKGFTIKDRLLRPSLVGVAKKRMDKTKKDEENKDNIKEK